jgi:hypothetical protein
MVGNNRATQSPAALRRGGSTTRSAAVATAGNRGARDTALHHGRERTTRPEIKWDTVPLDSSCKSLKTNETRTNQVGHFSDYPASVVAQHPRCEPQGSALPGIANGAVAQKKCHTVPPFSRSNPMKTKKTCAKEVSQNFGCRSCRAAKVANQEHARRNIVVHPRIAFAIVVRVLAFLQTGSAPQRRRDPALRRRGCCGGVCAGGPRRRLRSGLPPLPRRFCARSHTN